MKRCWLVRVYLGDCDYTVQFHRFLNKRSKDSYQTANIQWKFRPFLICVAHVFSQKRASTVYICLPKHESSSRKRMDDTVRMNPQTNDTLLNSHRNDWWQLED